LQALVIGPRSICGQSFLDALLSSNILTSSSPFFRAALVRGDWNADVDLNTAIRSAPGVKDTVSLHQICRNKSHKKQKKTKKVKGKGWGRENKRKQKEMRMRLSKNSHPASLHASTSVSENASDNHQEIRMLEREKELHTLLLQLKTALDNGSCSSSNEEEKDEEVFEDGGWQSEDVWSVTSPSLVSSPTSIAWSD
jgi:hypothetical protein